MPNDMAQVIVPKSDQLNADDLISGPRTIRITGVTIRGGQEQPISVSFEGDNGKPYKPCKSMCRVMVSAWGADSKHYAGRSMTLYRDPSVKWAGMDVGGIRISHMSDIDSAMTMALTITRANRKPFTVRPLAAQPKAAAQQEGQVQATGAATAAPDGEPSDNELAKDIATWCKKGNFDMARDLCRSIKDDTRRGAADDYISSKEAELLGSQG